MKYLDIITNNNNIVTKEYVDNAVAGIEEELPTKTSELTNDSGFITTHQDISGKADKATTLAGYGITNAYTKDETDSAIASIVDSAPEALDTLNELAAALDNDANFSTTIISMIGEKIPNPSTKSNGQVLTYNGTNWIASDPEVELPTATVAGTAVIYNGTEWITQTGYGYSADTAIFSKTNATTVLIDDFYGYNDTALTLIAGQSYTTTIDGVAYTSTAIQFGDIVGIGNPYMDPSTGDPYLAMTDGEMNIFYMLTDTAPTSHTITISGSAITKISSTLLPRYPIYAAGVNNSVVQDIPEAYKGTDEEEGLTNNIGDVLGSAVFGYGNTVADDGSFIAGVNNKATDFGTFIIGQYNETGRLSYGADRVYIYGQNNNVKDNYGLAIGFNNTVDGEYCTAIGRNLTQSSEKYVFGSNNYNYTNDKSSAPYIAVGDNSGGNAVEISSNGDIWFKGDAYVGSTSGDHQDSGKKKLATTDAATTSTAGLMSASDKAKLDGIAAGATANNGVWGQITGTLSSQTDLNTILEAKENASNKVTSLSSSSTDIEFPSSKAVYDLVNQVALTITNQKGAANGVATLDANSKVPTSQLSSNGITYKTTITGDGSTTSFSIVHNLNSRDIIIQVYDLSDYKTIQCDTIRDTVNIAKIEFETAPVLNKTYRVLINLLDY